MRFDPLWALQLGPVRVTAVQAAIGAAVTFVVGAGLVFARGRIAAWWAARQDRGHADHTTLGSGWWSGDLVGASSELLVCVRAAPSKMLPAPVRLDVERIAPFVREAFGDHFPAAPEFCDPTEMVRYIKKDPGHPGVDQQVVVWPSGLIEAMTGVSCSPPSSRSPGLCCQPSGRSSTAATSRSSGRTR